MSVVKDLSDNSSEMIIKKGLDWEIIIASTTIETRLGEQQDSPVTTDQITKNFVYVSKQKSNWILVTGDDSDMPLLIMQYCHCYPSLSILKCLI